MAALNILYAIAALLLVAAAHGARDDVHTVQFDERTFKKMSERDVIELGADSECGKANAGFMDVTFVPRKYRQHLPRKAEVALNTTLSAAQLNTIEGVDAKKIVHTITELSTNFPTRFFESASGAKVPQFLVQQYKSLSARLDVREFVHKAWPQNSVIARLECKANCIDDAIVVIGSHLDSIVALSQQDPNTASPGADDDASGSACVLETARVLLADATFSPRRTIEFHHYAAEEVGLWGSQDIASTYEAKGVRVAAQLQLDMTGYSQSGPPAFVTDYTSAALTRDLQALATALGITTTTTQCGYGCSDHASFNKAGYPSAFLFEADFAKTNPAIHTTQDTLANIDGNHAALFSKVAVAAVLSLTK